MRLIPRSRRGWIVLASVVAIVLAIALTPFAFDYAVGAWTRHEILQIANPLLEMDLSKIFD